VRSKSNRLNRIEGLFSKTVCSTSTVRRSQYDRLSQQQLSLLSTVLTLTQTPSQSH